MHASTRSQYATSFLDSVVVNPNLWDENVPPSLVAENRKIEVYLGSTLIARSDKVVRVVSNTGDVTTFYIPRNCVKTFFLEQDADEQGYCKWRGEANYFNIDTGAQSSQHAACYYAEPSEDYVAIKDHVCFHPARVSCYLDGERVWAQRDDKNGAWLTPETVAAA